jgi:ABC-2 type transport system ATP-binding protein
MDHGFAASGFRDAAGYLAGVLSLAGLVKRFDGVAAVDGLSLRVERGQVFGLLGPNGAGKSTTIGMAMGLLRPDAGRVQIEGHGDPAEPTARRALGVAPQAEALYEDLTGMENLRFFARIQGVQDPTRAAGEALERVGLSPRGRDRVKTYSGGMRRRLNLAAAIVHRPPLLLLDEPTAGVDPQSRASLLELVRSLAQDGSAVLYTTHYMEEAAKLCDRVGIMDRGRLLDSGTVDELLHRHGTETLVFVQRNGHGEERVATRDPMTVVSQALQAGEVTGLRVERPDLETVFLALTGRSLRD